MPRLRKRHLPHLVDIKRFLGETSAGESRAGWVENIPAYVEQKTMLIIDRRPGSTTEGKEVVSSTLIVLLPEETLSPRDVVRVFKGTTHERTSETIDSAFRDYPGTPSHTEGRLE